jgi:hypothetical protein
MVKSLLGSIGSLIVVVIGHVGDEKLMDETFAQCTGTGLSRLADLFGAKAVAKYSLTNLTTRV